MKSKITVFSLLMTVSVMARVIIPFHGWSNLTDESSDILVVKCQRPTPQNTDVIEMNAPRSSFQIEVVMPLKGTNNSECRQLKTDHDLQSGQTYLVFGLVNAKVCTAYEEYRVMPLGVNFSTNSICGKPLNEQIHILLQRRLDELNRQLKQGLEEKQRIEEAFVK